MSIAQTGRLSLQEVLDATSGGIYAINTAEKKVPTGGDVNISVASKDGKVRTLVVHRSWIPVDLTASVPRAALVDSGAFHDAVSKGLIALISKEEFDRLNNRSGAAAERARIEQKAEAARAEQNHRALGKTVTVLATEDEREGHDTTVTQVVDRNSRKSGSAMPRVNASSEGVFNMSDLDSDEPDDNAEQATPEISPTFRAFVNSLNTMDAASALNSIRSRGELPRHEVQYLSENIIHQKLKAALEGMLNRM